MRTMCLRTEGEKPHVSMNFMKYKGNNVLFEKVREPQKPLLHSVKVSKFEVNSVYKRKLSKNITSAPRLGDSSQSEGVSSGINNFESLFKVKSALNPSRRNLYQDTAEYLPGVIPTTFLKDNSQDIPDQKQDALLRHGDQLFNSLYGIIKKERYIQARLAIKQSPLDSEEQGIRVIGKLRFRDYFKILQACYKQKNIELVAQYEKNSRLHNDTHRKYQSLLSAHVLSNNLPFKRFHIQLKINEDRGISFEGKILPGFFATAITSALKDIALLELDDIILVNYELLSDKSAVICQIMIPCLSPNLYSLCLELIKEQLYTFYDEENIDLDINITLRQAVNMIEMNASDISEEGYRNYGLDQIKKPKRFSSPLDRRNNKSKIGQESPEQRSPLKRATEIPKRDVASSLLPRTKFSSVYGLESPNIRQKEVMLSVKGGFSYSKPGLEWIKIGLNVKHEYDEGDSSWLEGSDEWTVGYCSIAGYTMSAEDVDIPMYSHQNKSLQLSLSEDIGPNKGRFQNPRCETGIVLLSSIEVEIDSQLYTCAQTVGVEMHRVDKWFSVVLQCRVRSRAIRVPKVGGHMVYMVNDPKDVRPYGILIKEITKRQKCQIEEQFIVL